MPVPTDHDDVVTLTKEGLTSTLPITALHTMLPGYQHNPAVWPGTTASHSNSILHAENRVGLACFNCRMELLEFV